MTSLKISKNKAQALTNIKNYSISQLRDMIQAETENNMLSRNVYNKIFKQIINFSARVFNQEDKQLLEQLVDQIFETFDPSGTFNIDYRDLVTGLSCLTNDKFHDKTSICWTMYSTQDASENLQEISISLQQLIRFLTSIYKISYLFADTDKFETLGVLPDELAAISAEEVFKTSMDDISTGVSLGTFYKFIDDPNRKWVNNLILDSKPENKLVITVAELTQKLNMDNLQVCVLDIWQKDPYQASQWRTATILDTDPEWNALLIHYNGWDKKYDFWMGLDHAGTTDNPNYKRLAFMEFIGDTKSHILNKEQFDFSIIPSYYRSDIRFSGKSRKDSKTNLLTDDQLLAQMEKWYQLKPIVRSPTRSPTLPTTPIIPSSPTPSTTPTIPISPTTSTHFYDTFVLIDIDNQFKLIEQLLASQTPDTAAVRENLVKILTLINQFHSKTHEVIINLLKKAGTLTEQSTNIETVESNESSIQTDWDYIQTNELCNTVEVVDVVSDASDENDASDNSVENDASDESDASDNSVESDDEDDTNDNSDNNDDEDDTNDNTVTTETELNKNCDPSYSNSCIYADLVYQLRGEQHDYDRVMSKPLHLRKVEYELIRSELETLYADKAFQLRGAQADYESVMEVALEMRKQRYLTLESELQTFYAEKALQLTGKKTDYDRVMAVSLSDRQTIYNIIESEFETHWADQAFQLRGLQSDYSRVMLVELPQRQAEFQAIQLEMDDTPTHRYNLRSRKQ